MDDPYTKPRLAQLDKITPAEIALSATKVAQDVYTDLLDTLFLQLCGLVDFAIEVLQRINKLQQEHYLPAIYKNLAVRGICDPEHLTAAQICERMNKGVS